MTSAPSASAMAIDRARRLRFCCSVSTMPVGAGLPGKSCLSPEFCCSAMRSPSGPHPVAMEPAQSAVEQQDGEQDEQIEDGVGEQMQCGAFSTLSFALG